MRLGQPLRFAYVLRSFIETPQVRVREALNQFLSDSQVTVGKVGRDWIREQRQRVVTEAAPGEDFRLKDTKAPGPLRRISRGTISLVSLFRGQRKIAVLKIEPSLTVSYIR